jgi:hypothetical protein
LLVVPFNLSIELADKVFELAEEMSKFFLFTVLGKSIIHEKRKVFPPDWKGIIEVSRSITQIRGSKSFD